MFKYEAMYIIKPTVEAEARTALIEKFSQVITGNGGQVESVEERYYVLVNFEAEATLPAELERNFRINENVMRYIVIKKEA